MGKKEIYWTIQLICWSLYIIYTTSEYIYYKVNINTALISGLINLCIFIISTHLYYLAVNNKQIELFNWRKFIVFPILANFIISIIVYSINLFFWNITIPYSTNDNNTDFLGHVFCFTRTFRLIMPWFIFYHGIKFAKRSIHEERAKLEAEMHVKEIELVSLRSQLNPHFLFNSLNSIQSLTLTEPKLARDATMKLSDLLRVSLSFYDLRDITFQEELLLVKNYLDLEKMRFDERLNYKTDISKTVLMARVPPMSLQLLAENAVKHGISKLKNGGNITVFAHKKNNILIFGIQNTGTILADNSEHKTRKGIGLENLNKRLLINYGLKDALTIECENNIVTAQVSIPFKI
ncbi:histidine kinase [Arcicella aquatica]|uniref:Histidine kinase n=1 Tax=Arcicella aquatica TaxID=217141 RepID=A0ABU5QHN2_9BACT|nr:histidine kinase [Arcicella aquatica]MEA5256254.1 histidine kinase [Arcicella aquatica]